MFFIKVKARYLCDLTILLNSSTQINKAGMKKIQNFERKRVELNNDLTVDLGNGETGIWNLKPGLVEMEFDITEDESVYLLYQVRGLRFSLRMLHA